MFMNFLLMTEMCLVWNSGSFKLVLLLVFLLGINYGLLDTFLRYTCSIHSLVGMCVCTCVWVCLYLFCFLSNLSVFLIKQRITEIAGVVLSFDPKPIQVCSAIAMTLVIIFIQLALFSFFFSPYFSLYLKFKLWLSGRRYMSSSLLYLKKKSKFFKNFT